MRRGPRASLGIGLASLLLWGSNAIAGTVVVSLRVVDVSEDGESVLVRSGVSFEPKGGSLSRYELWSASAPYIEVWTPEKAHRFGSTARGRGAERADCVQQLHQLAETLKRRGFDGVKVRPAACGTSQELVTGSKKNWIAVRDSELKLAPEGAVPPGLGMQKHGDSLDVFRDGTKLCSFAAQPGAAQSSVEVHATKGGRLVFAVQRAGLGLDSDRLLGLCDQKGPLAIAPQEPPRSPL